MDSSETLFRSARVIKLSLASDNNSLAFEGFCDPILEVTAGKLPQSVEELAAILSPSSRENFLQFIKEESAGECPLFFSNSSWFLIATRPHPVAREFFIQCSQSAASEHIESEKLAHLNHRLKLGMSEAHHRVKNTLQNIISYINILFTQRSSLDKGDVQKLIAYIHGLSSLHDILLEEVKAHGEAREVRLDRVINDVLAINSQTKSLNWTEIPELITSPRRAATISLIINELLDDAACIADASIDFSITRQSKQTAALMVVATGNSHSTEAIPESRGMQIVHLLAKADLQSQVSVIREPGRYQASILLPVGNSDT